MIALAYLGSQCTKFQTSAWMCWCFMSLHLESCIWPDSISRWIRQRTWIKFCTNIGKSATETLLWLDKCSGKKAWAVHGKSKLTETEKGETGEEHAQNFFNVKGIFRKEFALPGQTMNSTYYYDILWWLHENAQGLRYKLWRQKNWPLHHDNAPSHTLSPLNMKLKDHNINTIGWLRQNHRLCWISSENTTSRMHLKMAEALWTMHMRRRGLLWGRRQHKSRKLWMALCTTVRNPFQSIILCMELQLCFFFC
jgi:hypothetical protein